MREDNDFNEGLAWFVSQPANDRERLVQACEAAEPAISLPQLAQRVAGLVKLGDSQVNWLLTGLGGILAFAADDPSLREFASNYLISLVAAPDQVDGSVKRHLERLLACDHSIGLSSKAQGVMWGQGRVFQRAQTISQVRPIFRNDLSTHLETAVIVHELRIDYREGHFESAWSAVMDRQQISSLIDVLQRALQKETGIRKNESFHFLDIERG